MFGVLLNSERERSSFCPVHTMLGGEMNSVREALPDVGRLNKYWMVAVLMHALATFKEEFSG